MTGRRKTVGEEVKIITSRWFHSDMAERPLGAEREEKSAAPPRPAVSVYVRGSEIGC